MLVFTEPMLVYVVLVSIAGVVLGDCVTAPSIVGASHNGSATGPYSEGMVLRYLCTQAYDRILGGSNYYQCSSGAWTGGNMRCRLGSCVDIKSPPNSDIVGQAGYYVGETITFSCQEGYKMNGEGLIMCMADRTWSPELPTCVKVRCPEFSIPDADIFQDFSGIRNEFGNMNKITCKSGTVLQGPQYITCLANKTWSGSPRCTIPNCGNPPAYYENCTQVFFTDGRTDVGSQVEVICSDNAVPTGANPFLICTNNGTWNHEYRCLCGCIVEQGDSVYSGPINVLHNTEIEWPCLDGRRLKRKCVNGTLTPVPSCSVTHPTTRQPVTHPTTRLLVTHSTKPLLVTHPTTLLPITHPTKPLLVSHPTTLLPVTHPTKPLLVTHPTPQPPPLSLINKILIGVISVVVCTIVIITLNCFFCPCCKNRRAKIHARYKFCFQDERSNTSILPKNAKPTLVPLVQRKG